MREAAGTSFKHVRSKMQNGLGQLHTSISQSTASHSNTVQEEMGTLDQARAGAYERLQKGQQDRAELLQEIQIDTQQTYDYLRSTLSSTSESVQETVHGIVAEVSQLGDSVSSYSKAMNRHLGSIQHATATLHAQGTKEDQITGSTPKKRIWEYTDEWEVTKDRETVLKEWQVLQAQGPDFGGEDEGIMNPETVPSGSRTAPNEAEPVFIAPVEQEAERPAYIEYEIPILDDDETPELERGIARRRSTIVPAITEPPVLQAPVLNRRITRASAVPTATKTVTGLKRPSRGKKRPASSAGTAIASSAPALSEKSNATVRKRPKLA